MKNFKKFMVLPAILLFSMMLTGCWNYREIDDLAIVAGVAIDKGTHKKFQVTTEIVHITGGAQAKATSQLISMEGDTVFEAARTGISISGKRLYWSHNKLVIISQDIAREGVVQILDWFNRDAETRADIHLLVAKTKTAREILQGDPTTEDIKSYELDDMLTNQKSLNKAAVTEIWEFTNKLEGDGVSPTTSAITVKQFEGKGHPQIMGAALFKKDRLAGFIDGEQTMDLMFVQNKVKGGLIVLDGVGDIITAPVSLEVFANKTSVKPEVKNQSVTINIKTETEVAIDEIGGTKDFIEEKGRLKLEQETGKMLQNRIESTIRETQRKYGVDIFGFGAKIKQERPQVWRKIAADWPEMFPQLKVKVDSKVHIRNSAMLSKTLKVGD